MSLDLLIAFPPFLVPKAPPIGPYQIKAAVETAGKTCKVLDLNLDLFLSPGMKEVYQKQSSIFNFFGPTGPEAFEQAYESQYSEIFRKWAEDIVDAQPRFVGISLFSYYSILSTKKIIDEVRKLNPSTKFILGGAGIDYAKRNPSALDYLGEGFELIWGDAEKQIVHFLQEGQLPVVAPVNQNADLDALPMPSYDRDNFEKYDSFNKGQMAYLTGSRGCIRKCTFCDVYKFWPRFYYKSSEKIFREIKNLFFEYGRRTFAFSDSLINGNVKVLRELCQLLIQFQKEQGERIYWGGQFICRPTSSFKDQDFDLIKEAGCAWLTIGIESGSESVRAHMKKLFSNKDIHVTLSNLARVKISTTMLMIVGYVTETEEDFVDSLNLVRHCHENGYLTKDSEGWRLIDSFFFDPLTLIPETDITDWTMEHFDFLETPSPGGWSVPGNDRKVRLERLFRMISLFLELGCKDVILNQLGSRYQNWWKEYLNLTASDPTKRIHISNAPELFFNKLTG